MHSHAERGNEKGKEVDVTERQEATVAAVRESVVALSGDRSHAPRGNAALDAPRHDDAWRCIGGAAGTRSVPVCIPTQSVGTICVWDTGSFSTSAEPRSTHPALHSFGRLNTASVPVTPHNHALPGCYGCNRVSDA